MPDKEDEIKTEEEQPKKVVSSPFSKLDKAGLFGKLDEIKKEVSSLRDELNSIDSRKEAMFEKKEKFRKEVSDIISDVKDSKSKRNSLTKEVKDKKGRREELNRQIKDKIEEIKKLGEKKKAIEKKHNIKGNPSMIKEQIDRLESRVETEVMSFNREQQIMKSIKDLKKQFVELKNISDVWEEMHTLSKEVERLRQKSDETHKKIQSKAKESQVKHEDMISRSKDIEDLKAKEKEAFDRFSEDKKKFTDVNNRLKEKLMEMNQINQLVGEFRAETKRDKKKKDNVRLKDKEMEVQEKIRNRKKLTTEDLLIFQGSSETKRRR